MFRFKLYQRIISGMASQNSSSLVIPIFEHRFALTHVGIQMAEKVNAHHVPPVKKHVGHTK